MNDRKRQNLPQGLWVVATPIGNLADLTPRARQALESCDRILCEDTRRTSQLLAAAEINASMSKLERFDAHSSEAKTEKLVELMKEGQTFALVSDAGTPAISDPGSELVRLAHEAGVLVTPVAGASSVTALLSVAGFTRNEFTFRGFFPRKKGEIEKEIEVTRSSAVSKIFVWFESPQRIQESLELIATLAPEAKAVAAKELTKVYEKIFHGSLADLSIQVKEEIEAEGEKGEWCFAIEFSDVEEDLQGSDKSSDWVKALHCLIDCGVSPSEASKKVSQHFGEPKKNVYEMALRISGKKIG